MILTLIAVICLLLFVSTRKPRNFPPGPPRIPVFGRLFGLQNTLPKAEDINYGRLMGFYIGNYPAVAIQDFQLAKQLLNTDEWSGRTKNIITRYFRSDNGVSKGIFMSDGPMWLEQKRFVLKHLKDFGFGKSNLEGTLQEESEELIKYIESEVGPNKDFKMETLFSVNVLNIMWSILAGRRFQRGEPRLEKSIALLNRIFRQKINLIEYALPWYGLVRNVIPGLSNRKKIIGELRGLFRETLQDHKEDWDENNPRDLTDVYLGEIAKGRPDFDMEQYELVCLDFFKASAETTPTTFLWCVMYLILHQDEQEKCYQEILKEVGNRKPVLTDNLPYCQAFMNEVQRIASVVPQTFIRRLTKATKVDNYDIPKDTLALASLARFMWDPEHFEEPQLFKPERFLEKTPEGLKLVNREYFVPYGFGKRKCIGATLARDIMFIIFTSLVQRFAFTPPKHHPAPSPKKNFSLLTHLPDPYWATITPRERVNGWH